MRSTLFATAASIGLSTAAFADTRDTVQAFVILPVTEAAHDSFLDVMAKNVEASRAEAGNISFEAFEAEDGTPGIFLVERWKNQAAIDAHMQEPHLKAVEKIVGDSVSADPQQIWLKEVPEIPALPVPEDEVSPRNIVVMLKTDDAHHDAFLKAFEKAVPKARAADGNMGYNIYQVADKPNDFVVVEHWASAAQHEKHLKADYSAELDKALGDGMLVANPMDTRWVLSELSFKE
ncbi:antibiotic biosynthesis monooxygenase [Pseudooceanicola sp. CBS1P-1]|nr:MULTISPECIES: antibiotic biosynthesis monooxygenase [Pseudooceanicola]MBT9383703.1 antibiotic biosynthesis monooxygenase [Pseudooceanicola endophyticus]